VFVVEFAISLFPDKLMVECLSNANSRKGQNKEQNSADALELCAGLTEPWEGWFPRFKKPTSKPVKPTGSLGKNFRHGLGWELDRFMYQTGPVPPGSG
jgi:hypothetical protein